MYHVDLNSDLGESFGAYTIGLDKEVIDRFLPPMWPAAITPAIPS